MESEFAGSSIRLTEPQTSRMAFRIQCDARLARKRK